MASGSVPRDHPLDKPVAKWTEEEILDGKVVEAGVVILRTRGCYWSIKEGCSMCGYFNDTVPGGVSDDMLREQWQKVRPILKGKKYAKIYTSGSFIDPTEVPFNFADEVMSDMSDMGVEKVLIESLPEFVNPKNFAYTNSPKLEIAIGLESSSSIVLDKSVNKRLRWPHFVKVCKLARDNGAEVKAYILLKPPYLGEKEGIEDAIQSAIDAAPHVDKISINPVNVPMYGPLNLLKNDDGMIYIIGPMPAIVAINNVATARVLKLRADNIYNDIVDINCNEQ